MSVINRLLRILEHAHSLSQVLDASAEVIAHELKAEACTVFLLYPGASRLLVGSSFGRGAHDLATVLELAEKALASDIPTHGGAGAQALLAVPMAARGHPIGAIVVQSRDGLPYASDTSEALFALAARLVGIVEGARFVDALEHASPVGKLTAASDVRGTTQDELVTQGTAAAPGIALGSVAFRHAFPRELVFEDGPSRGELRERERVRDAVQKTHNDLLRIQSATERDLGEEQAFIFSSHLLLLQDPMLRDRIDEAISSGMSAGSAILRAFQEFESRLRELRDPYIQERAEDLEDLCSRMLEHILMVGAHAPVEAQVIMSRRITPSLVIEIKAQGALGIVAEIGTSTSHGVLLARSLGIPAVTGVADFTRQVQIGEMLIIDGAQGKVIARPTAETLAIYRERLRAAERERTQFSMYRDRPPLSADGVRIELQANVAFGADLALAKENGADGIGLYRTEFPFMVREGFPTRDEQMHVYRKAYEFFPRGPIAFRILDLAGDKFIPNSSINAAQSAFHGYRSIRVLFDYPHVLRDQVQAFVLAAGEQPLRILIPMVSSFEELERIKELISAAIQELPEPRLQRAPELGIMIEVPAAVAMAAEFAREVDFLSIGTNDLIQYSQVIDREDARMASARDAYHPAVLRMVRQVTAAAHASGKKVSVCGEMATRPDLAAALVALGVDTLSVAPRFIPELKQAFSFIHLKPLAAAMDGILACRSAKQLEIELLRHLSPSLA